MRALTVAVLVITLTVGTTYAQGSLTVEELVARALVQNPELQAARADVKAAHGRLRQAGFRPNPMAEVMVGRNITAPDNTQSVGISWPLDLGGRRDARVTIALRELAVKEAQVADRERRLVADVRLKAGELFAAERDLRVLDALIGAGRENQRLVAERVRQGAAPALDERLLEVEITRLDAQRAVRAGRVEAGRVQFAPLIGASLAMPLQVIGDLEIAAPPERALALRRALEARSDVRLAALEEAVAQARVEKERADGRYDASVIGRYQREETGFDLMGMNGAGRLKPIEDVFHMLMLGVSVTLPVRHRNQGNIAAAQAEVEAAQRRRESTQLVVMQELESAYAHYHAIVRAIEIYTGQVLETARQNLETVRQAYALGRVALLDAIAEQRRYIDLESGYTELLRQRWEAVVDLQRASGVAR